MKTVKAIIVEPDENVVEVCNTECYFRGCKIYLETKDARILDKFKFWFDIEDLL